MSKQEFTDFACAENSISLKAPTYGTSNPRVWFIQLENYFRCRKITSQLTMFSYVATQLPTDIASEVIDLLDTPPAHEPYTTLKTAVLRRTTASDEARLKQLLSGIEMGDRTPSQLLRHMRSLAGHSKLDDSILHQLWSQCLPPTIEAILTAQGANTPLDKLADIADAIYEKYHRGTVNNIVASPPIPSTSAEQIEKLQHQVSALTLQMENLTKHLAHRNSNRHRSRSPSHSSRSSSRNKDNRICKFHRRYGNEARNCVPFCTHPSSPFRRQTPSGNAPASQ